jgi:hypothetical protein
MSETESDFDGIFRNDETVDKIVISFEKYSVYSISDNICAEIFAAVLPKDSEGPQVRTFLLFLLSVAAGVLSSIPTLKMGDDSCDNTNVDWTTKTTIAIRLLYSFLLFFNSWHTLLGSLCSSFKVSLIRILILLSGAIYAFSYTFSYIRSVLKCITYAEWTLATFYFLVLTYLYLSNVEDVKVSDNDISVSRRRDALLSSLLQTKRIVKNNPSTYADIYKSLKRDKTISSLFSRETCKFGGPEDTVNLYLATLKTPLKLSLLNIGLGVALVSSFCVFYGSYFAILNDVDTMERLDFTAVLWISTTLSIVGSVSYVACTYRMYHAMPGDIVTSFTSFISDINNGRTCHLASWMIGLVIRTSGAIFMSWPIVFSAQSVFHRLGTMMGIGDTSVQTFLVYSGTSIPFLMEFMFMHVALSKALTSIKRGAIDSYAFSLINRTSFTEDVKQKSYVLNAIDTSILLVEKMSGDEVIYVCSFILKC